jgi:hypothetical protein
VEEQRRQQLQQLQQQQQQQQPTTLYIKIYFITNREQKQWIQLVVVDYHSSVLFLL